MSSGKVSETLQMISKRGIGSKRWKEKPLKYVYLGDNKGEGDQVSVQIIHTHNSIVMSKQNLQPYQDQMGGFNEEYPKNAGINSQLECLPE